MKYARILGTGSFLPEKTLTNADLEKMVDTTEAWILERTGIRCRHVLEEGQDNNTMVEIAANRAIEAAQIDKNKIGMVIVATVTPDTLFPNVASRLQYKLGINAHECPAFDLSGACAGFIYALSIANQYIKSGAVEYALVVGSEALTKFTDWTDRSTCILFSDGAGAVVLGADSEPGIYSTHLHADGAYGELLNLSGSLYNNDEPRYIRMKGNEVFKVAVKKLSSLVDETLAYNNITSDQIDWLIPHQANMRIIAAIAKKLSIPKEKVICTIAEQGNTSSASVPLALDIGVRDGRVKRGDMMLLEAFGAGFLWGSALIRY
jgi:3-oxoacyl-[acyl-carrier-protein] synthase-3